MGEAFKLHSESLFGYDDAVAAGTNISTPTMSSAGVGVGDLEMQNVEHVYWDDEDDDDDDGKENVEEGGMYHHISDCEIYTATRESLFLHSKWSLSLLSY